MNIWLLVAAAFSLFVGFVALAWAAMADEVNIIEIAFAVVCGLLGTGWGGLVLLAAVFHP